MRTKQNSSEIDLLLTNLSNVEQLIIHFSAKMSAKCGFFTHQRQQQPPFLFASLTLSLYVYAHHLIGIDCSLGTLFMCSIEEKETKKKNNNFLALLWSIDCCAYVWELTHFRVARALAHMHFTWMLCGLKRYEEQNTHIRLWEKKKTKTTDIQRERERQRGK